MRRIFTHIAKQLRRKQEETLFFDQALASLLSLFVRKLRIVKI